MKTFKQSAPFYGAFLVLLSLLVLIPACRFSTSAKESEPESETEQETDQESETFLETDLELEFSVPAGFYTYSFLLEMGSVNSGLKVPLFSGFIFPLFKKLYRVNDPDFHTVFHPV